MNINDNPPPQEELQDETIVKFLHILEDVCGQDNSCEDLFACLDEFVEREMKSHDAAKIMPLIREHLDACDHCHEAYEALLAVLEHTQEEG